MTTPKVELRCPFCHTVVAPHVSECHRCHAKRHTRKGMTLRNFRRFVATWVALAVPLMLMACWVGFAPWAPSKPAPGYALALIGAKASAEEVVRCRVEVAGADGHTAAKVVEGACGPGSESAPAVNAVPSMTERRMATALHSLLCLSIGLIASWGLLLALRQAYLTKAEPSWVQRAAA
ncbi:hypothetical protein [Ramlibacter humi]|uniref:Uncharacterized protein n=1 Tax=Ramlibacter humi TaxID=2530451 RepID=A0A4Z0CBV9_9BURK|nr:hypothetical protein [Ramlibacter humi]TFZ07645.1 hypothetical protein EZ216_00310 [Ramlibacter humi]